MTFARFLPDSTRTPIIRKAALTIAGLAFTSGAIAGPITAIQAAPAEASTKPVAAVAKDDRRPTTDKQAKTNYEAQPNFYYCGPASTRIALTALGQNPNQDEVAKQLGTTEAGTNSAEDITRVLNKMGGRDAYHTTEIPTKADKANVDKLRDNIVKTVDDERAVVANIIGTATDTDGDIHSYEGGHYLTVVGYRDNGGTVQISDPANPSKSTYWVNVADLANWITTRGYSH